MAASQQRKTWVLALLLLGLGAYALKKDEEEETPIDRWQPNPRNVGRKAWPLHDPRSDYEGQIK